MNEIFNLRSQAPPAPSRSSHRRDTPAVRLAENSADYLSDSELLSLILHRSRSCSCTLDSARSVLDSYGSLSAVAAADLRELQKTDGLGPANAAALHGAFAKQ